MMASRSCSMCRAPLPPGADSYVLEMKLFADFDGIIDLTDDRSLQTLAETLERMSAKGLEEQVYMERRHILCPRCRAKFLTVLPEPEPGEEQKAGGNGNEGNEPLH